MVKTYEIRLDRRPALKTSMKPVSELRDEAARDGRRMRKELEQSKPEWLKRFQADHKNQSRRKDRDKVIQSKKAR